MNKIKVTAFFLKKMKIEYQKDVLTKRIVNLNVQ